MQGSQASLFTRDDTFFGVCEAIGEDFGFNPLFLRVTLGVAVLWNPIVVLATYATLGVVVAATRLLFPNPRQASQSEQARAGTDSEVQTANQNQLPQNDDQPSRERLDEFA